MTDLGKTGMNQSNYEVVRLMVRVLTDEGSRLQSFRWLMPKGLSTDEQLATMQDVARAHGFTVVDV